MWNNYTVSVILPCYNEEAAVLGSIQDFLDTGVVDEIIVVDNNSTDRTTELAASTRARVVYEKRQGYGFALRRGLIEAVGDLIILAEPDGTFSAMDVFKLLTLADDFDIVLGTRTNTKMIRKGSNMNFFNRNGNRIVAKLLELLFDTPSLSDCGCTMRLFHRPIAKEINSRLTVGGSYLLPEMVIWGRYFGAKMVEVPVNYGVRLGKSKITGSIMGTTMVGLNMIALIIVYRFKFWFGLHQKIHKKSCGI